MELESIVLTVRAAERYGRFVEVAGRDLIAAHVSPLADEYVVARRDGGLWIVVDAEDRSVIFSVGADEWAPTARAADC